MDACEGISKNSCSLFKGNTVLSEVRPRLDRIPSELHLISLRHEQPRQLPLMNSSARETARLGSPARAQDTAVRAPADSGALGCLPARRCIRRTFFRVCSAREWLPIRLTFDVKRWRGPACVRAERHAACRRLPFNAAAGGVTPCVSDHTRRLGRRARQTARHPLEREVRPRYPAYHQSDFYG